MTDIFISYSKQDPEPTRKLAAELKQRGYTVWWDTSLLAGDNFRSVIVEQLNEAKAVIVIWTPASMNSHYVIDEANRGLAAQKLIPLRVPAVAINNLPLGFGVFHTAMVEDLEHVLNALTALGVRPTPHDAIIINVSPNGVNKPRAIVPGNGRTDWFKDHPQGPEMVVIPAGNFMMGSLESEPDSESPQHKVMITQPFAVSRHAVTRGQFASFVSSIGYQPHGGTFILEGDNWEHDPNGSWRSPGFAQDDSHPVVCVSWFDAKAYATWLSQQSGQTYRLPSESEWEYAARAGTTTPFWWGTSITPTQANYNGKYIYAGGGSKGEWRKATVPVGSFQTNPWGLFNVHGNVWEWCEDVWHDTYNGAPTDSSAWLQGGGDAGRRIARGGSWNNNPRKLRAANRHWFNASFHGIFNGFRLVRTL
jgi:formylglycine-generating enzyme required for sulfatase activity